MNNIHLHILKGTKLKANKKRVLKQATEIGDRERIPPGDEWGGVVKFSRKGSPRRCSVQTTRGIRKDASD